MKFMLNFVFGITFGIGLILSKLFQPETILQFFNFSDSWNPSLFYTIVGLTLTTSVLFLLRRLLKIDSAKNFMEKGQGPVIDKNAVLGAFLLGIGWSIAGLCASTSLLNLAFGNWQNIVFFTFMVLGLYSPKFVSKRIL